MLATPTLADTPDSAPRIYLAGPDVFFPDYEQRFKSLSAALGRVGLLGVVPADNSMEPTHSLSKPQQAMNLYQRNIALIESCDAVLANLNPFRNDLEPDSGTCFEVGYAVAKGKPVVGLVQCADSTREQIIRACGIHPVLGDKGLLFDARYGMMVEDFNLPLNLMLACGAHIHTSLDEACAALKELLSRRQPV